jgi:lambda repressor-like predicted transcriptional regulator/predicted DNA-binding protein YlxM (UPF0122 family)
MLNKNTIMAKSLLLTLVLALALPAAAGAAAYVADDSAPGLSPSPQTLNRSISAEPASRGPNAALLDLLKTDEATLRSELAAGKSLADIAEKNGVSKEKVIDLLVSQHIARLNEAVKAGQLTEAEAGQWKANMEERVRQLVDRKGGPHRHHHRGAKRLNDIAQVLGMNPKELIEELKKGKSIVQIGKEKGISESAIESKLLEKEKARLHELINRVWGKGRQVDHS